MGKTCEKVLGCGHPCCGFKNEEQCLPCLDPACVDKNKTLTLEKNGDDFCTICYTEGLS